MKPLTYDRGHYNVLHGKSYHTPHRAVTDGAAMVELYTDRRKPKNSEKILSYCYFVHYKSHME
jgi:hypothetical protein